MYGLEFHVLKRPRFRRLNSRTNFAFGAFAVLLASTAIYPKIIGGQISQFERATVDLDIFPIARIRGVQS